MACSFLSSRPVTCRHGRSHISLRILFKVDKKVVWVKTLLEIKNGPCDPKNGSVVAHNRKKSFFSP